MWGALLGFRAFGEQHSCARPLSLGTQMHGTRQPAGSDLPGSHGRAPGASRPTVLRSRHSQQGCRSEREDAGPPGGPTAPM